MRTRQLGKARYFENLCECPTDSYVLWAYSLSEIHLDYAGGYGDEPLAIFQVEAGDTMEKIALKARKHVPFSEILWIERLEDGMLRKKELDDDWDIESDPEFRKELKEALYPKGLF